MPIQLTQYAIIFALLFYWLVYFLASWITSSSVFALFTAVIVAVAILFVSQLIFNKFSTTSPVVLRGRVREVSEVKPMNLEVILIYTILLVINFVLYLVLFTDMFQAKGGNPLFCTVLRGLLVVLIGLQMLPPVAFYDAKPVLNPFFRLFGYKCYRVTYAVPTRVTYVQEQEDVESREIVVVTKVELLQEDLKYFDMEYLDLYEIDEDIYFLKGVKSSVASSRV